jgi:hypothetical protein
MSVRMGALGTAMWADDIAEMISEDEAVTDQTTNASITVESSWR